jgi:hypothetical protein
MNLENDPCADLAYRRIDALLRAYGLNHAVVRSRYANQILENALTDSTEPTANLEARAAAIVLHDIDTNLNAIAEHLKTIGVVSERDALLLALRKTGIPSDRPDAIIGHGKLGKAEIETLAAVLRVQPSTVIKRVSMGAPTIRFTSIDEVTGSTIRVMSRFPLLRKIAVFAILITLIGVTIALSI